MGQIIYIGNYSTQGINRIEVNEDNSLQELARTDNLRNSSYICKYKNFLYSVVEISGDKKVNSGYVVAYEIKNKKMRLINTSISYGRGPCFLIVEPFREILFVANYVEGSFVAFKLEKDGSIGKKIFYKKVTDISNIHHIQFSNDYKKMYIIDLGADAIIEYEIDYNQERLNLIEKNRFVFPKKSEPRHMVIDNKNNIFVITEKSCELYKLDYNLIVLDKQSILPAGILKEQNFTGCAIKIDLKAQYIYVSVRGHNSISVFDISNNSFKLIQNIKCEGNCPRDIAFDKYQKYLMCANQLSNNISIFSIQEGMLKYESKYDIEAPSCIIVD